MTTARHPREELQAIIEGDKPKYVRTLFDSIARDYDRMNRVMTGGLLGLWHKAVLRETRLSEGEEALDVCCGTGDLALAMARRVGPRGRVVGVDFSEQMLAVARERAKRSGVEERIEYHKQDALRLEFGDGGAGRGFHAVTMGFALRNVGDIPRSLAEMARVARVGGRIVCLEVSRPENPILRLGFNFYFFRIVPLLGRLAERGARGSEELNRLPPYTYLPYSLERLSPPGEILAMMRSVGLGDVRRVPLTGGAVSLYVGEKLPPERLHAAL